jgi:hypothetical protein
MPKSKPEKKFNPGVRFFKSKKSKSRTKPKDDNEITEKDFLNHKEEENTEEIETGDNSKPVQITNVNVTIRQDEDGGAGCGEVCKAFFSCLRPS